MSKIYTKTGDTGSTNIGKTRKFKNDKIVCLIGEIDELNCHLGRLIEEINNDNTICLYEQPKIVKKLIKIQHKLFNFGSDLNSLSSISIFNEDVLEIESWIDEIDEKIPKLKNFILPRGNLISSQCHICRSVCRRVERSCVNWTSDGIGIETLFNFDDYKTKYTIHLCYLNRLSDFLFVLARYLNHLSGQEDIIWSKDKNYE